MNTNTEYELLAQEIYQILLDSESVRTIKINHNILVEGISGQKHQIDVFWEYNLAGVVHKVAIECKNYNKRVSVGKVRDFSGVLRDIPNTIGIMLTTIGYQEGAIKYADTYGINLMVLRNPIESDWEGRLKKITVDIRMFRPEIKERIVVIDEKWMHDNTDLTRASFDSQIQGLSTDLVLIKANGEEITNFQTLDDNLPHSWKSEMGLEHTYPFDEAYLEYPKLGKIKILGVKYIYNFKTGEKQTLVIDGAEMAKVILKNVITGELLFFNKDGSFK